MKTYTKPDFSVMISKANTSFATDGCNRTVIDQITSTMFTGGQNINCFITTTAEGVFASGQTNCTFQATHVIQWTNATTTYNNGGSALSALCTAAGFSQSFMNGGSAVTLENGSWYILWTDSKGIYHGGAVSSSIITSDVLGYSY